MKIPKLLLTIIIFFASNFFMYAQFVCGFDVLHKKQMTENATYRKNVEQTEVSIRQYIKTHQKELQAKPTGVNAALHTIPVVVHVIHTGGAIGSLYNPTDAQINGAITYLNQVFDGSYPGTQGVGDLQIQFVMARRDPNCNPSNGINRIDGSVVAGYVIGGVNYATTAGTDELNIKNLSRWSNADYYNIWLVNKIDGVDGTSGVFTAGYAYFAGSSALLDGTVMLASQMQTGEKTLPHEIGHAFNLFHPFQGSNDAASCPTNSNCNIDGDGICDTDPISFNKTGTAVDFSCRTGANACNGGSPYSINTENNYMNYTACYSLFTAGQKARLLATAASPARASLSTSLGGTATNDATNPCDPKINFEIAQDQPVETPTTTVGCRKYRDYSYNMLIGNTPIATATATLTLTGTATEGQDFDITTNGDFNTPSKTLTFTAGSNSPQPFTIRIYDDASVEIIETVIIDFTVNNGGGNAIKGTGKPTLTFAIQDNDIAPIGPSNITKSIGTSITTLISPFAGGSAQRKSQFLYKAAELTTAGIPAGNIVGLSLDLVKSSSIPYQNLTIKMGATLQNSLSPISEAAFTTVYSANYSTVDGINNFVFSSPFTWDGTSNVAIVICYDNGVATSIDDDCKGYSDGIAGSNYIFSSTINCGGAFSAYSLYNGGLKPIIQFVYADPGTEVQTVLNSSKQEYLAPNADVYFYDQTTNKLLARVVNSSSFDYGCTQVIVDRSTASAGADAVPFRNNLAANYLISKTLKVIPTVNNPTGAYQISLYYTQPEINAWLAATGQTLGNIQLIKVGTQIADVTPGNPTGGTTTTIVAPTISTFASNTVLTATFANGFSGFGAGVAGVSALPVTLIKFTGELNGNSVVLNWHTSFETNSKSFDIERSYDGITFTKVGMVNAAGNSTTAKTYAFTDPAIAQANNYYRLKQVDIDGKFEYSKSILVKGSTNQYCRVINKVFTNTINLQFNNAVAGKVEIKLLDATGKEIYSSINNATSQSTLSINLQNKNISAGIYLLQIKTNNQQLVERVVKQ